MAHRRLAWTPAGYVYDDGWSDRRLDVNRRERVRQALGVVAFFAVLMVVCLLSGGPA